MINTQMISTNGLKMINNGNMVLESRWLFSSRLMDLIKRWWSLQLKKSKKPHSLIFKNIILKCWRRDTLSLILITKSKNSKVLKWKEEDSLESLKSSKRKFSHSISKVPHYRNATLIALKLLRNIWQLYKNKGKQWILTKFWTIYNNREYWVVSWQIMVLQKVLL